MSVSVCLCVWGGGGRESNLLQHSIGAPELLSHQWVDNTSLAAHKYSNLSSQVHWPVVLTIWYSQLLHDARGEAVSTTATVIHLAGIGLGRNHIHRVKSNFTGHIYTAHRVITELNVPRRIADFRLAPSIW